MVKALIFDLDGVLVDSVPLHYQAWAHLAEQHQRPFDQHIMDSFRGLHRSQCLEKLFAPHQLSQQEITHLANQKNTIYQQMVLDSTPDNLLIDGVLDLLDAAQNADLRLGIASSSVNAKFVAEHTGLTRYMHAIADGNTVTNGKPATDIFVWVAGALHTSPADCIVFEDGLVGIQSAKKAGMYVVGIGNGDWLMQADCRYLKLNTIQLNDLLRQASIQIEETT